MRSIISILPSTPGRRKILKKIKSKKTSGPYIIEMLSQDVKINWPFPATEQTYLHSSTGIKFITAFLYKTWKNWSLHTACRFCKELCLPARCLNLSFTSSYLNCASVTSILLITSIAGLSSRSSWYSSNSYKECHLASLHRIHDSKLYTVFPQTYPFILFTLNISPQCHIRLPHNYSPV